MALLFCHFIFFIVIIFNCTFDIARNHVIPRNKETENLDILSTITTDASIVIVKIMDSINDSTTKQSKPSGKWIFPTLKTPISSKTIDMTGPICSIAYDVDYDDTWTEKSHRYDR